MTDDIGHKCKDCNNTEDTATRRLGVTRRETLAGASTGIVALSGCSGFDGDSDTGGENHSWPTVADSRIENWNQVSRETDEFSKPLVDGYVATKIFNDTKIREDVREKTLGQFDEVLATFFATKINLEGYGTSAARDSTIADRIAPKFKSQMEDNGIQNVQATGTSSPVPSDHDPVTREYRGTFPTSPIERDISIPDVGERTLKLPADELEITGLFSVWKTDKGTAYAGGAVFPAENFHKSDTISVTGKEGTGIDVIISVDLNLSPRKIRRNLVEMIESIE